MSYIFQVSGGLRTVEHHSVASLSALSTAPCRTENVSCNYLSILQRNDGTCKISRYVLDPILWKWKVQNFLSRVRATSTFQFHSDRRPSPQVSRVDTSMIDEFLTKFGESKRYLVLTLDKTTCDWNVSRGRLLLAQLNFIVILTWFAMLGAVHENYR